MNNVSRRKIRERLLRLAMEIDEVPEAYRRKIPKQPHAKVFEDLRQRAVVAVGEGAISEEEKRKFIDILDKLMLDKYMEPAAEYLVPEGQNVAFLPVELYDLAKKIAALKKSMESAEASAKTEEADHEKIRAAREAGEYHEAILKHISEVTKIKENFPPKAYGAAIKYITNKVRGTGEEIHIYPDRRDKYR